MHNTRNEGTNNRVLESQIPGDVEVKRSSLGDEEYVKRGDWTEQGDRTERGKRGERGERGERGDAGFDKSDSKIGESWMD